IATVSPGTWTPKAAPPQGFVAGGVAVNGRIYVVGSFGSLEEYNPVSDSWTSRAPLSPPEQDSSASVAINGKVYIIGGIDQNTNTVLNRVSEFDPSTNTWATKAPITYPSYRLAAAALDGKAYVLGGATYAGPPTRDVQIYDPVSDTWTFGAYMPTARFGLT